MPKRHTQSFGAPRRGILTELKHPSLRHMIVERIHVSILNGKLKPGQQITEKEICSELGVSRTSVREAIHDLRNMGVITFSRRRAYIASEPSPEAIQEVYELRAHCEAMAAESSKRNLNARDLERLERLVDVLDLSARKRDLRTYLRTDLEFHDVVWRASRKDHLIRILEFLTTPYHFLQNALILKAPPSTLREIARLHRNHLEDLKNLRGKALQERVALHYRAVGMQIVELYRSL